MNKKRRIYTHSEGIKTTDCIGDGVIIVTHTTENNSNFGKPVVN